MKYNPNKISIFVTAGAGGDDAKDWANMLLEMYKKYANRKSFEVRKINENTIEIKGNDIYEKLKDEIGVHRLVRISPFSAKNLRHTSFALVDVLPELPETEIKNIQLPEGDLKIDFYRSGGPGGQNVNKVETAVRIVHLPTGIAVSSQVERSQSLNREKAMRLLKAKLAKLMEERQEKEVKNLKTKAKPEWGHEIRSYVLHPYKQVKIHKTGKKFSQVEKVLEGDLDVLLE